MPLPNDFARCQPAGLCLRRMRCARYVERDTSDEWTPMTAFEPTGCEAFIPAEQEPDIDGGPRGG